MKLFYSLEKYLVKFGNKTNFIPIYKYSKCQICPLETKLIIDNDCISNGMFCGYKDESIKYFKLELKINSGRVLIIENLRQKCVFKESSNTNRSLFFKYVDNFSDVCADTSSPNFNEICSNQIIEKLKIDKNKIDTCISEALKGYFNL